MMARIGSYPLQVTDIPLLRGEVTVWYWITHGQDEAAVRVLSDPLSAEERARRDRLVSSVDRRDFTAAHLMLRHALSLYEPVAPSQWVFSFGEHGKPFIGAPGGEAMQLTFSLSHTRGLVTCAIARGTRLGVDVEQVKVMPEALEIARCFFAPSEVRSLGKVPSTILDTRFVELWTLKEAYIKATGIGLTASLDSFAFDLDVPSQVRFSGQEADGQWQFLVAAPTRETRLALAVERSVSATRQRITCHSAASVVGETDEWRTLAESEHD